MTLPSDDPAWRERYGITPAPLWMEGLTLVDPPKHVPTLEEVVRAELTPKRNFTCSTSGFEMRTVPTPAEEAWRQQQEITAEVLQRKIDAEVERRRALA